jgi:hypothetical protein
MENMKKKKIQIDVMRDSYIEYIRPDYLVRCKLYIDGNATIIWISQSSYQVLIHDGFFIRDGKETDSSGAVNTTEVYVMK